MRTGTVEISNTSAVPLWQKYALTVEKTAELFGIGITQLRNLAHDSPDASYLLQVGNRTMFKRQLFADFLDKQPMI